MKTPHILTKNIQPGASKDHGQVREVLRPYS